MAFINHANDIDVTLFGERNVKEADFSKRKKPSIPTIVLNGSPIRLCYTKKDIVS